MKQIFNITHIIICITCIVFPMRLWGVVGGDVCYNIKTDTTTCAQTAGCYLNNGTCAMCPGGSYCTNNTAHSCGDNIAYVQNGGEDMLELAKTQTNMGLTSFDECLTYAQFTLYCPASHYFGQSGTKYKCIKCTAKKEDGTTQTAIQTTKINGATGTIKYLLENYGRNERCLTCGKNAKPDDDGIGCVCEDGFQFIGRSETEVYDNTACEKKTTSLQCNQGYYVKSGKCEPCDAGTYQAKDNYTGTECTPCDIGYYNDRSGQATCSVCPAGTYQDKQQQTSCIPCPAGTYNPNKGSTTIDACKACVANATMGMSDLPNLTNIDKKCDLTAIDVTDKTSSDNCKYTLKSAQGYYLTRGANNGYYYNFTCNQCPTLTTKEATTITGTKDYLYNNVGTVADGHTCSTNCSCNGKNNKESACIIDGGAYRCECKEGYHVEDENRDTTYYNPINGQKDCVINEYYIQYYCNDDDKSPTKKFKIEYYNGHDILASDDICQKTGYTFNGWLEKESRDTYTYGTSLIVTQDYKFFAQWDVKTFDVYYYSGDKNATGEAPKGPQKCTYGETCAAPANSYKRAGYIFANWSCLYRAQAAEPLKPCLGTDTDGIKPGDDISKISDGNNIILTAIWKSCPNGYYCPGEKSDPKEEPQACPAGSTSADGADAKTDCYMTGGTTKICDTSGNCFTLPESTTVYYHGGE